MWHLYLDESGDLGFDFVQKKPSEHFTIAIILVKGYENNRALINSVRKTLKRKLNKKRNKQRYVHELKGSSSTVKIKKFFFNIARNIPFEVFSVTLRKRKVYESLSRNKPRVYNWVARMALDKIRLEDASVQVDLIVDKCKGNEQIKEFNDYIIRELQARINPNVPLNIIHGNSTHYHGLQAADLFSWGVFRTYEKKDLEWYRVFEKKVRFNGTYL